METERLNAPNWGQSGAWDEFQWEHALKYSDGLAARYFRMLERYGDLPDAEELIASRLGHPELFPQEDADLYDPEDESGWTPGDDEEEDDDDELPFGGEGAESRVMPGDALYFETFPVYRHARQIALGWCNILATVLEADDRFWGLQVLSRLGRVLAYLAMSIGDGTFERPHASIAFAKRALAEVNEVLGEVNRRMEQAPGYANVLRYIQEHQLKVQERVEDYLLECRRRLTADDDVPF